MYIYIYIYIHRFKLLYFQQTLKTKPPQPPISIINLTAAAITYIVSRAELAPFVTANIIPPRPPISGIIVTILVFILANGNAFLTADSVTLFRTTNFPLLFRQFLATVPGNAKITTRPFCLGGGRPKTAPYACPGSAFVVVLLKVVVAERQGAYPAFGVATLGRLVVDVRVFAIVRNIIEAKG